MCVFVCVCVVGGCCMNECVKRSLSSNAMCWKLIFWIRVHISGIQNYLFKTEQYVTYNELKYTALEVKGK